MARIPWLALCGCLVVTARRLTSYRSATSQNQGARSPVAPCEVALRQAHQHLANYLMMLSEQHASHGVIWIHGLRSQRFPWVTLDRLKTMIVSLDGGCEQLFVGDSSRSNATLWKTRDGKWVLKSLKSSEIRLLEYCDTAYSHGVVPRSWSLENHTIEDWPMLNRLAPGTNFWVKEDCAKKKENWDSCIILDDPFNDLRDAILGGTSIMVEISLIAYTQKLIVMPNFRYEVEEVAKQLGKEDAKGIDKYDIKPLQVKNSAERVPFLVRMADLAWSPSQDDTLRCGRVESPEEAHAAAQSKESSFSYWKAGTTAGFPVWLPHAETRGVECWRHLRDVTFREIEKASNAGNRFIFVDYSSVFVLTEIPGQHLPEDLQLPVSCIVSTKFAGKTLLLCLYGIDYLMDYDFMRGLESFFKGNKFKDYASATREMVHCAGDLSRSDDVADCRKYLKVACENHVTTRSSLGKIPEWCELVPEDTPIHRGRHCPFVDLQWRSCSSMPTGPDESGCGGGLGVVCGDLARHGARCSSDDVKIVGWSVQLGRAATSLEACCCYNLASYYTNYTMQDLLDSVGF